MFDTTFDDNQRLKRDLAALRQTIMAAEPTVLVDGRFEQMITTPTSTIQIAQTLIAKMVQQQHPF